MSPDRVQASLARIEAKLDAIDSRLGEATADLRELRSTKTRVATQGQTLRTHSRIFWALGVGFLGLAVERLKSVF